MPMVKIEDYGGGREGNDYCVYCCDPRGNLKSYEESGYGWKILLRKTKGVSVEEA